MLQVRNLTKKYGKTVAVSNVSFDLSAGEVTVLLGPNGAGKSTLIKSVVGLLRAEGEISVCGMDHRVAEARRLVGYIPELPALYPNLTAWEHMEFLARAYKMKDWQAWGEALFERFELTDKKKKFGDELSKGMQQKLNLCLGLLPMPKIVLLDEPMIGLDPHAIKELKNLLLYLKDQGCAVLVSTHMIDSVDLLFDRAFIMQKGEIRADLTRREIDEKGLNLEETFFEITEARPAEDEQ